MFHGGARRKQGSICAFRRTRGTGPDRTTDAGQRAQCDERAATGHARPSTGSSRSTTLARPARLGPSGVSGDFPRGEPPRDRSRPGQRLSRAEPSCPPECLGRFRLCGRARMAFTAATGTRGAEARVIRPIRCDMVYRGWFTHFYGPRHRRIPPCAPTSSLRSLEAPRPRASWCGRRGHGTAGSTFSTSPNRLVFPAPRRHGRHAPAEVFGRRLGLMRPFPASVRWATWCRRGAYWEEADRFEHFANRPSRRPVAQGRRTAAACEHEALPRAPRSRLVHLKGHRPPPNPQGRRSMRQNRPRSCATTR